MSDLPSEEDFFKKHKHLLLVDDDDLFRDALAKLLEQEGFLVTQVAQGKLAQNLISIQTIDAVISDIQMPDVNGIDLMLYAKKVKPRLPVILMTGFSHLKETVDACEMGAGGFLPKPFKKEEIISLLNNWFVPKAPEEHTSETETQDADYCKLSINDFISGNQIKYDIYVRISERKYLKIAHQGEDIPLHRIDSYKAKNIRFLYMLKEDFRSYMGLNLTLLPLVKAKSTFSVDKKRAFLRHTSDVIMEHLHFNGVDDEGFQGAKVVVESTAYLLTESDDMMSLLHVLNSHADYLYAHALGVSIYAVMIAKALNWNHAANIYKVAMGGLLHDIGMKEIPREVLSKTRIEMSADELKLYESHAQRGLEILGQISAVPSDVLQIVMQHHENCLGLGFPSRLAGHKIHPMARVVSIADDFCTLVLKNPKGMNLSPPDAIQRMCMLQPGRFDPKFMEALRKVFNILNTESEAA